MGLLRSMQYAHVFALYYHESGKKYRYGDIINQFDENAEWSSRVRQ